VASNSSTRICQALPHGERPQRAVEVALDGGGVAVVCGGGAREGGGVHAPRGHHVHALGPGRNCSPRQSIRCRFTQETPPPEPRGRRPTSGARWPSAARRPQDPVSKPVDTDDFTAVNAARKRREGSRRVSMTRWAMSARPCHAQQLWPRAPPQLAVDESPSGSQGGERRNVDERGTGWVE